jgi:hypothetical protein
MYFEILEAPTFSFFFGVTIFVDSLMSENNVDGYWSSAHDKST